MELAFKIALYAPLTLLAIAAALWFGGYFGGMLIDRDGGHQMRYDKFMAKAREKGLSYHDADDELYMREELARVRREASDAVCSNSEAWLDAIITARNEAIERVALNRSHLAQPFAAWLTGLTYGDILYPAERQMVDRLMMSGKPYRANADQYAALKIVR